MPPTVSEVLSRGSIPIDTSHAIPHKAAASHHPGSVLFPETWKPWAEFNHDNLTTIFKHILAKTWDGAPPAKDLEYLEDYHLPAVNEVTLRDQLAAHVISDVEQALALAGEATDSEETLSFSHGSMCLDSDPANPQEMARPTWAVTSDKRDGLLEPYMVKRWASLVQGDTQLSCNWFAELANAGWNPALKGRSVEQWAGPLRDLALRMVHADCRYGFIITDDALVIIRLHLKSNKLTTSTFEDVSESDYINTRLSNITNPEYVVVPLSNSGLGKLTVKLSLFCLALMAANNGDLGVEYPPLNSYSRLHPVLDLGYEHNTSGHLLSSLPKGSQLWAPAKKEEDHCSDAESIASSALVWPDEQEQHEETTTAEEVAKAVPQNGSDDIPFYSIELSDIEELPEAISSRAESEAAAGSQHDETVGAVEASPTSKPDIPFYSIELCDDEDDGVNNNNSADNSLLTDDSGETYNTAASSLKPPSEASSGVTALTSISIMKEDEEVELTAVEKSDEIPKDKEPSSTLITEVHTTSTFIIKEDEEVELELTAVEKSDEIPKAEEPSSTPITEVHTATTTVKAEVKSSYSFKGDQVPFNALEIPAVITKKTPKTAEVPNNNFLQDSVNTKISHKAHKTAPPPAKVWTNEEILAEIKLTIHRLEMEVALRGNNADASPTGHTGKASKKASASSTPPQAAKSQSKKNAKQNGTTTAAATTETEEVPTVSATASATDGPHDVVEHVEHAAGSSGKKNKKKNNKNRNKKRGGRS